MEEAEFDAASDGNKVGIMTATEKTSTLPAQHQNHQPGIQSEMQPQPRSDRAEHRGSDKLKNRAVLITGGDSGIGRAVAIGAAKEGARVAIVYLEEDNDARETKRLVEDVGGELVAFRADVGDENECRRVVDETVRAFGRLDVLVNDAGEQHPQERPEDITAAQIEKTFRTNVFSQFFHDDCRPSAYEERGFDREYRLDHCL